MQIIKMIKIHNSACLTQNSIINTPDIQDVEMPTDDNSTTVTPLAHSSNTYNDSLE